MPSVECLETSVFVPSKVLKFLGMLVDSVRQAFLLSEKKKVSLRDNVLAQKFVSLKTLQRFSGKCISFMLAVSVARLYRREVNLAIGKAFRNLINGRLKEEICHWKFLDSWDGFVLWRQEKHLQVCIATDASLFKLGAVVDGRQVIIDQSMLRKLRRLKTVWCQCLIILKIGGWMFLLITRQ